MSLCPYVLMYVLMYLMYVLMYVRMSLCPYVPMSLCLEDIYFVQKTLIFSLFSFFFSLFFFSFRGCKAVAPYVLMSLCPYVCPYVQEPLILSSRHLFFLFLSFFYVLMSRSHLFCPEDPYFSFSFPCSFPFFFFFFRGCNTAWTVWRRRRHLSRTRHSRTTKSPSASVELPRSRPPFLLHTMSHHHTYYVTSSYTTLHYTSVV